MPKFTDCRNCRHLLFSFVDAEGKMISCIQDIKNTTVEMKIVRTTIIK